MRDPDSNASEPNRFTSAVDAAWWARQLGVTPDASESTADDAGENAELVYPPDGIDRKSVEEKLASTEARRRDAQAQLEQNAARLAELEEERAATLGKAKLAEQRAADLEVYLERLRQELAAVEVTEAQQAAQDALRARDAAITNAAEAAAQLVIAIEGIRSARANAREAHRRLRALDSRAPKALPPEKGEFDEQWRGLAPMVEAELNVRLESELVEAAARSSNHLIRESLPEHLRELAEKRRRDHLDSRKRARTDAAKENP
jgi:hypothetical protein